MTRQRLHKTLHILAVLACVAVGLSFFAWAANATMHGLKRSGDLYNEAQ